MNDFTGSIASFDQSLRAAREANQKPVVNVNALRGDSLARIDRYAEAEEAFRAEIALYPENPLPYRYLEALRASLR